MKLGTKQRYSIVLFLSLISVTGYLLASRITYAIGFPLDDAWIHQTYARNLAQYGEWSFVHDQPSAGSTAPLWTAALAIGDLLGLGPYVWTYFLGWLILAMSGIAGLWIFQTIISEKANWSLPAGMLLVTEWHLAWSAVSGMETGLFVFWVLIIMGLILARRQSWVWIGFLIGLGVWIRPDAITLIGPAGMTCMLDSNGHRERFSRGLGLVVGFTLPFGAYMIWNRVLAGTWWPNTFYAKQAEYAIELLEPWWMRFGEQIALPNIGVGSLLLPGFIYYCVEAVRLKKWGILAGAIWAIGYLVLYAIRLPVTYQHGRYAMPMMPIYILWGFAGILTLIKPFSRILWRRVLSRSWLLAIGIVCLAFWVLGARTYGKDVAFIESEMVSAARWVAGHTEENATIAVHDIGALGYFGNRRILDLAGLVSPEVIPFIRDEDRLAEWITNRGASYLVTFPSWYPRLTQNLMPIYVSGGRFSQAFEGENMNAYRWNLRLR